ncbi:proteasome assembly chaperone family protein [Haloquadratum walsbyi]|jgi:Archaeal enzymes of ATP-grasp superfamily|uniref:Archaeal enzymes of ATP-grasp superfamily n=1 Tax=Haloquadratum walsbyi J07HQW2 TaxID=1238425 RepID=U1PR67_9EURY|nr:PAC2 family protein [Haloquadratum walsbyi]ERG94826.1 MAG: archaeal enzymes of ATP-grasp superfamily [Haloquadratum walsbyi J07HQW2]
MAQLDVLTDAADVSLTDPSLVEGLPGIGLVGKIAADHLVAEFDMTHYANVHCETIPAVAVYEESDPTVQSPVRVYTDDEHDLAVLQSDVPIDPEAATEVATCLSTFIDETAMIPIYLSGVPREKAETVPSLYGFGVSGGVNRVQQADIDLPDETGVISGPTGALLNDAVVSNRDAIGLVVESDPQFPDPEAARVLISDGIEPLIDIDVPVDDLVDRTEQIREAKERLAKRMQEGGEESTQARPIGMYQ